MKSLSLFVVTSFLSLGAIGLVGCAGPNEEERAERASAGAERERHFQFSGGDELAQRASFDLSCPVRAMEAQVLQRVGMFQIAVSAGVRGCGRKALFLRSAGTSGVWILSSPVQPDTLPTAAIGGVPVR